MIKNARLSFPSLFKKQSFENEAGKFKATFLLPNDDPQIAAIDAAIEKVAQEKFGAKASAILKATHRNDGSALRDGNSKDYDGYENTLYLAAKSDIRPLVLDRDAKTPLAEEDGKPYAGCYVNASVDIFAYDAGGKKGISAALRGVQFVADGEAFGSSTASVDEFADLAINEEESLI